MDGLKAGVEVKSLSPKPLASLRAHRPFMEPRALLSQREKPVTYTNSPTNGETSVGEKGI